MKDRSALGDPRTMKTPLCEGYRKFLAHTVSFFRELDAERIAQER